LSEEISTLEQELGKTSTASFKRTEVFEQPLLDIDNRLSYIQSMLNKFDNELFGETVHIPVVMYVLLGFCIGVVFWFYIENVIYGG